MQSLPSVLKTQIIWNYHLKCGIVKWGVKLPVWVELVERGRRIGIVVQEPDRIGHGATTDHLLVDFNRALELFLYFEVVFGDVFVLQVQLWDFHFQIVYALVKYEAAVVEARRVLYELVEYAIGVLTKRAQLTNHIGQRQIGQTLELVRLAERQWTFRYVYRVYDMLREWHLELITRSLKRFFHALAFILFPLLTLF